jgi:hypothetical protein
MIMEMNKKTNMNMNIRQMVKNTNLLGLPVLEETYLLMVMTKLFPLLGINIVV